MNKADGFISLHRKILNWEWYQNPNTFRLFVHCLLMANFTDGKFEGREIKRGQFVTSLDHLSAETRLSIKSVRTALEHLIQTGELASESNNRYRVITIVKYDQYQMIGNQNGRLTADKGQANGKQGASKGQQYNNNNKENNDNKEIIKEIEGNAKRFTQPTKEEIALFCHENGLQMDIDYFIDYYNGNGWMVGRNKMKDWRAAVRNWVRREKKNPVPQQTQKVLPAQDFQQRDYSGVQDEMLAQIKKDMERYKKEKGENNEKAI